MKPLQSEVSKEVSKLSQSGKEKHIAKPYRLKRYYTPMDVAVHNTANDCWVTFFNEVYDLTKLVQANHECKLCN
jgi:Cytochrome b5-like Heme/Steroid binding domain.